MNVYCLMNPRCRFASSQTPILCGREETEGLKAPGYSKPRLPDVLVHRSSFIVHRSQLTTHCSQLIAQNVLMSNPFGGIGAICVSKNLGRCTQTSLPLITHRSLLTISQNSQCGAPIKSPHCIRSRIALSLPTHRIAFFRSLYKNGAQTYIKVVRHPRVVMLYLLLHASLIADEQGCVGACLSDGVEEGTV